MSQTIEITITPRGDVSVQTKGFTGASCHDASRFIEQALGEKTAEQNTAEFYATTTAAASVSQKT